MARNEQDQLQDKDISTPIGLYNYLVKIGLGDTSVLKDLSQAQTLGYYFPGVTGKIVASLNVLGIKETNFQKFVAKNNAEKRMVIYKTALAHHSNKILVAANALRIEDIILRSEELRFAKRVGSMLFGEKPDAKLTLAFGSKVVELQKLQAELSPEFFVAVGYGVPLVGEFDSIPQYKLDEVSQKSQEYSDELKALVTEFFPEEINELKNIKTNRAVLIKIISGR